MDFARSQVREYFARMNAKALKLEALTREELWRKNVEAMKSRWPWSKVNSWKRLARLAEVSGPYVSRLENACPTTDDPSPEVCRVCAVLGVTPESLWQSHLEIEAEVTLDPTVAASRVAEFRTDSATPTIKSTSDSEIIAQFSLLDYESKQIVTNLIRKLARIPS